MKTKRKWSEEEKRSILKEAAEQGVIATCNKHAIFPGTYYNWKEKLGKGLPDVKKQSRDFKKLVKENSLLKKLLVEKELEFAMAMELIKKKSQRKRR